MTTPAQDILTPIGYRRDRQAHWDSVAGRLDSWRGWGGYYHRRLAQVYSYLVAPGLDILEIGCGGGDLLAFLKPALGVGVDISGKMLKRAADRHPHLQFAQSDSHMLGLEHKFDVIILSDLLNDAWDVQVLLEQVERLSRSQTRLIINSYSRLWQLPLAVAQNLRLAKPQLPQNWLTFEDVSNLLHLAGFEVIRSWHEVLFPLPIPLLASFFNRYLVKLPLFSHLALTNFVVARPLPSASPASQEPLVSVVVPARNEAGNIPRIFSRTPEMGSGTELVFIEGHSKDDTYDAIERAIAAHPERRCQLHRQTGIGKGDAVRLGFAKAQGEVLMILDADLTVPPEDLPRFYQALRSGRGEFVNGVRLVYPMEEQAMRFLNFLGNKFFSVVFSWLLDQPIKDTLCGTKVIHKYNYDIIAANRAYFGDFDPFGDFDLLFGAARQNLKIVEVPIRYRQRTYGTTNIHRWRHGWLLLKMVAFAARKIKFI